MKVYAKCNLSLEILGKRADGYHELDMAVCSVSAFDEIEFRQGEDQNFICVMDGAPQTENSALRAARLFQRASNCPGGHILIRKGIPVKAGLGGSSADAAGVLMLFDKLFPGRADVRRIAADCGSDTVYMLEGGFARMRGRGERVDPFACSKRLFFVFLVPEGGVSTPEAFRISDGLAAERSEGRTDGIVSALKAGDLRGAGRQLGNDLTGAAQLLNPGVKSSLSRLAGLTGSHGFLGVNMTGSGSGVYALFDSLDEAERAAAVLNAEGNELRAFVLQSRESGIEF